MRKPLAIALSALSLSLALAAPAAAQQSGLVASSATSRASISSDYTRLVAETFPVYDDAILTRRLSSAIATLASRPDTVTVRSLVGVERAMGFSPSGSTATSVETATSAYSATSLRATAQRKAPNYLGLDPSRFAVVEPNVQAVARTFLGTLGLQSDELMKVTYRRVVAQSVAPTSLDSTDGTPQVVRRGTTFVYRGYAGFPIEGAEARVSSFDGTQVDGFALRWERFVPHRQAVTVALAPQAQIQRAIVDQLARVTQTGDQISLYMGVVFRPVLDSAGQRVYIPAMKVVVTPQPKLQSLVRGDVLTEAGAVFYANLLATPPSIMSIDTDDANTATN